MFNNITEEYLNSLYDNLHREQMTVMNSIKSSNNEVSKDKDNQKQITIINTLMINTLRLRNLKKQILEKNNM
jgi:hypothetical protein